MKFGVFLKDKMFNPSIFVESEYFEKRANGDLVFIVCDPETGFENEVGLILHGQWYAVKAVAEPIKPASEDEKNEDQP